MRKLFRASLLFISLIWAVTAKTQVFQNIPLLTVYGEAAIKTNPDMAVLTVDVERTLTAGETTLSSAAFLFNDADIQIKMVSTEDNEVKETIPLVRLKDNNQVFVKEYTITVKNLSKLQDLVIDLYKRNLGTITFISYRYSGIENVYAQARKQAIANARTRAQAYSEASMQTIGKAFQIRELVMETKNSFDRMPMIQISDMLGEKYVLNPGYITVYCKTEVSYDLTR